MSAESVLQEISVERASHQARGWTAKHDRDQPQPVHHLVQLAQTYAKKPGPPKGDGYYSRQNLVKAASLLVAAIELIDIIEEEEQF